MSVEEAAESIASSEFVRVVAHADADGVSSAACVCSALSSLGVSYHFTALEDPSEVPEQDGAVLVLCDLGAQYLDRIYETVEDVVVIDHHPPRGVDGFEGVLVGTEAPSSSVAAHQVAREIGVGDPVAALVGAIGDGVALEDVQEVIDEALKAGVEREEGARIVGDNPVEALTYSTCPFTRLSGDYEATREFVEDVEEDNITTAVVLLALTQEGSRAEAVAELVGDLYRLPSGIHLHDLSRYVETCAVSGKHGLALSLCLDSGAHLEEARSAWRAFESNVIETVRGASIEEDDLAFARTQGSLDTGAVADVLYNWVKGDIVVVNEDGDASFRARSFDCGRVAREAARSVGGEGGGHMSRAGASFPASDVSQDEFVNTVRRAL